MDTSAALAAELTLTQSGVSLPDTPAKPRISAHRHCRVCGRGAMFQYLDLGAQPLADSWRDAAEPRDTMRVPLQLQACPACKLTQLTWTVPNDSAYKLEHADNVGATMQTLGEFATGGMITVELPYVGDLIEHLSFDAVQHANLNYWSVTALDRLCKEYGLVLTDARPAYAGAIQVIIAKTGIQHARVTKYLVNELHTLKRSTYLQFSSRVTRRIAEINDTLLQLTPYVGLGAGANTSVMLNCLDVRALPHVIFDGDDTKWDKTIPGTRVTIQPEPARWDKAPGPLCLFEWDSAHGILDLRNAGYRGDIFVPLPKPRWDTL